MRNKKLDRVIKKLYFSSAIRAELRENPATVASRFGLSETELTAVQSGDAHTLVTAGMDPRLVTDATPTTIDKMRLRTHQVLAFGLVIAGMFIFAPFAFAGARVVPRIGRRVGRRASPRYILGRVRARVSARAGERVYARTALRNVRERMYERGGEDKLRPNEPHLKTDPALSLQDPIQ